MTQYWITLKNVGNDGKIVVEFNENEVISECFVAGETEMHHSVNITNEIEAIIQNAEQVERRNALAEGADGRHDCLQSTQPKYTRNTLEDVTKLWNTRVTVEELLIQFQCYVYNTPIGAEDIRLGKSYYNWGKHYLDVLQGIAGLDIKRESRVTAPPQQNPTSVHKYTREELVEIMCRANADLSPVGSDALVYLSMDDCATGIQSPNWHRDLHKMHTALSALEQAGALQVKE